MLSSLTSGVSGLEAFQEQMDVIGNNIANVNTDGYKSQVVDFGDAFSNVFQTPSASTSSTSGADSIQVGTGVAITATNGNFSQGGLSTTGVPSNLAVSGNGFFMVRDTVTSAQYATRTGDFSLDSNGFLITDTGERVQGYSDGSLSTLGDVQINATGAPNNDTSGMVGYSISGTGVITVNLADGTSFTRGQVLMQNFQDPQKLINVGNNLYSNTGSAGGLSAISASGTNGLGAIQAGSLELSNVDLSNEMANLITAQRAFEANSKIITTSDEMLETLVNMKH